MHEGTREWAVMAISSGEGAAAIEGILTFGILWLDLMRQRAGIRAVEGLRLFVPEGTSRSLRERAFALSSAARVEFFEFCGEEDRIQKMDPADAGNIESWLAPRREVECALAAAREAIGRIHALSLHMPPAGDDIGIRLVSGNKRSRSLFPRP